MQIANDNIILQIKQRGQEKFNKGIDSSTNKVQGLGAAFGVVGKEGRAAFEINNIDGLSQKVVNITTVVKTLTKEVKTVGNENKNFDDRVASLQKTIAETSIELEKAGARTKTLRKDNSDLSDTYKNVVNQLGNASKSFTAISGRIKGSKEETEDFEAATKNAFEVQKRLIGSSIKEFNKLKDELEVVEQLNSEAFEKGLISQEEYEESIKSLKAEVLEYEKSLKVLLDANKDVSQQNGALNEQAIELADNYKQIRTRLEANNKVVEKSNEETGKGEKANKGLLGSLGGLFKGIAIASAAFTFLKDIISENSTLSNLLEKGTTGVTSTYKVLTTRIGEVLTGGRKLTDFFTGITDDVSDTYNATLLLNKALKDFDKTQSSLSTSDAFSSARISNLKTISDDVNKSLGQRLKSQKEINEIEETQIKRELESVTNLRLARVAVFNASKSEKDQDAQKAEIQKLLTQEFNLQAQLIDNNKSGEQAINSLLEERNERRKRELELLKQARESIIDLQNSLISDDEERSIAIVETAARRTIEGLVGSEEQIKIQTQLVNQLLEREIGFIKRNGSLKVNVEDILAFGDDSESEKVVKAFAEELTSRLNKELKTDKPIPIEGITPTFNLDEFNAQLAALGDGKDGFLKKFFGDDAETILKDLQGLGSAATGFINAIAPPVDLEKFDKEIESSLEKLERLQESQINGSSELIELEKKNIIDLERSKKEAADKEQQRQKALAISTASTNVVSAIGTILSLYQGGLLKGLAGTAAVIGGITTLVGLVKSFTFHDGVESVGTGNHRTDTAGQLRSDEVFAKLQKKERVLSVEQNKSLLALGVSNDQIPSLVALGLEKINAPSINPIVFANAKSDSYLRNLEQSNNAIVKQLQRNNKKLDHFEWGLNIDGKGFSRYSKRLKDKQIKLRNRR